MLWDETIAKYTTYLSIIKYMYLQNLFISGQLIYSDYKKEGLTDNVSSATLFLQDHVYELLRQSSRGALQNSYASVITENKIIWEWIIDSRKSYFSIV